MKKKNFHKQLKGVLDSMDLPDKLKTQMDKTECKIHVDLEQGYFYIELTDKDNLQSKRAYFSNSHLLDLISTTCLELVKQRELINLKQKPHE